MTPYKLTHLLTASLFCLACSTEEKRSTDPKTNRPQKTSQAPDDSKTGGPTGYKTKRAPNEEPTKEPKPILPDIGPADLLEWQIKATAEATAKIEGCKGYQELQSKNPEGISISTHKEVSPSMPFWVFAIQERAGDQTTILNYCTLTATTTVIDCDPVGATVCP
jgi:septal ring-binding cell division protein DamX